MKTKNLLPKIKNLYILIIGLVIGLSILVGVNAQFSLIQPASGQPITVTRGQDITNFVNGWIRNGNEIEAPGKFIAPSIQIKGGGPTDGKFLKATDANGNTVRADITTASGIPGTPGADGVSVSGASINADGNLILTLSNGATIDAGLVSTTADPWNHIATQNINLNDKRISNDGTDNGIQIDANNNIHFGISQLFTDGTIRAKNGISTTNIATSGQIIAYGANSDIRSQGDLKTSKGLRMLSGSTRVDYGPYFINSDGTNGQVWKSDGNGRGYRGVDEDTITAPDNMGDHTTSQNINLKDNRLTNIPVGQTLDASNPIGLKIDTDGRAIIGKTTADTSVKLDVGGNIGLSGKLIGIGTDNYISFKDQPSPELGFVGIGTTNPTAHLHINGSTRTNYQIRASCGTPDQNRGIKIGNGQSYIYDSSCTTTGGRWGDNTEATEAEAVLTPIAKAIEDLNPFPNPLPIPIPNVADYQEQGGTLEQRTLHIESNEGLYISAKDRTNSTDKTTLHLMNDGTGYILADRFGIGTNNPKNQFHVRGTSRFDGSIKLVPDYGQTNIYAADTAIGQGTDVTIRGGGTTAEGQVNGGDLELLGGTRSSGGTYAYGGAIVIKGGYNDTYGPSYNPPIGGSIFIYPGSTLSGNTRGNVIIGHNGTTAGIPLGKVGIGTKSPTEMLDVNGSIKANSIKLGGLTLSEMSDRLGVGIANPQEKLDVNGNALIRGTLELYDDTTTTCNGLAKEGILRYNNLLNKFQGCVCTSAIDLSCSRNNLN